MLAPPAPDFSDPIGMLAACHTRIQDQCDLLHRLCDYQLEKGADAQAAEAARRILRYFDLAAPQHHADEEQDLFPALQGIPDLQQLIQCLRDEHTRHAALWQSLRGDLLLLTQGQVSADLRLHSAAFIQANLSHIETENREILPRARQLLEPATLRQIGVSMARRRRP